MQMVKVFLVPNQLNVSNNSGPSHEKYMKAVATRDPARGKCTTIMKVNTKVGERLLANTFVQEVKRRL